MGINAIALLQIANFEPSPGSRVRVRKLEDGLLLYLGRPFSSEPQALVAALQELLGDRLAEEHRDPRGIFFLPDVVSPKAQRYGQVLEEIGEAGMWATPAALTQVAGGFEALLGSLLGQMPESLLELATKAATSGDPQALQQMTGELQNMIASRPDLQALAGQMADVPGPARMEDPMRAAEQMLAGLGLGPDTPGLAQLLGGEGIDVSSPAFSQLMSQLETQLNRDPDALAGLAEQLFGQRPDAPDEGTKKD